MTNGHRLRAAALGGVLAFAAGPAGAATGDLPQLGANVSVARLAQGGTSIVRPAQGAPVAVVELWYRAPSTGFGAKPAPATARLAAQAVAASKPFIGDSLGKVISDSGGRLSIAAYSDSVSISAIVPSGFARPVIKAMTTAYFAPVLTDDGFRQAQRDVAQEALISNFDPETAVRDAIFSQLFSAGPQHYPALGSPKAVAQIELEDVKTFAERAFRAQNATLVVTGDVDPTIAGAAVAGRPAGGSQADPESPAAPELAAGAAQPLVQDFAGLSSGGYGWVGPAISDPREATAMDFIADFLFRDDDGVVTRSISEKYPAAFLTGQFITLHDPGVMFVAYAGKDPDALKALVDAGFARMQQPLEPQEFAAALAGFKYHLLSSLQTPSEIADNFGWYTIEGAPAYAPGANGEDGAYFAAASSLTPAFVAEVASKYLGKPPAVVTLRPAPAAPGKLSQ